MLLLPLPDAVPLLMLCAREREDEGGLLRPMPLLPFARRGAAAAHAVRAREREDKGGLLPLLMLLPPPTLDAAEGR